jgi:hypothetical protein
MFLVPAFPNQGFTKTKKIADLGLLPAKSNHPQTNEAKQRYNKCKSPATLI